jgi:PAS domain S-box-containing protein
MAEGDADPEGQQLSFREMAEALGLGMAYQIEVSPDGRGRRFTYVGPSCQALTGVAPEAALRDPSRLYGLILPEDLEAFAAAEGQAVSASRSFDVEVRMRGPRGELRWVRIRSKPFRRSDGSTLWDGLLTDITAAKAAAQELEEQRRRLEAAVDATGIGLWEWDVPSGRLTWTERNRELFGVPSRKALTIETYQALLHPDDRETIAQCYREAAEKPQGGDFVVEHRTAFEPEGKVRWVQTRGRVMKGEDGVKLVVGATLDITDRKAAEERRSLLLGELAHRAKNGILVMMAIVAQTARGASSVKEFEDVLQARLKAMADNQDLVTATGGRPVQLSDVVATSLTPFDASRFDVDESLGDITIPGEVAVALGLLLHELSTNAVKYGALSKSGGRVVIRRAGSGEAQTVLKWAEEGGPRVQPQKRKGFGTRLLEVALRPQGGKVDSVFEPSGFRADIHFPVAPPAQERRAH